MQFLRRFFALSAFATASSAPAAAAPPPQATAFDGVISVATLNAWGLPFPIARKRGERMARIARFVSEREFHVVGLQEVWRGARKLLDVDHVRYPAAGADSGLALASSLPSTTPSLVPFEHARGPDRWKTKGVLTSQVQLDADRAVWMVVTHLQAGASQRNQRVRSHQVDTLLSVLEGLDGPAVVIGDFNLYDRPLDRESAARLEASGLLDAAAEVGAIAPTFPGSAHRFDRVYVRAGQRVDLVPTTGTVLVNGSDVPWLSDHHPVAVDLQWVDRDEAQAAAK